MAVVFYMFGILMVGLQEQQPFSRRAALRLRPARGLTCTEGLFRMAMYCTARVELCPGWSGSLQNRRVGSALQWLQSRGVHEAVLPESWQGLAREYDISPIRAAGALEACASQAVLEACRGLGLPAGQVCLAVCGRRISQTAAAQILTLAKNLRTVRIFGEDNENLKARLWRSCGIVDRGPMPEGVPVVGLLLPGGEAPKEAELTVDLTRQDGAGEGLIWSPSLLPPQGALARMPQDADPGAFAAALLRVGAIQAREIRVSRLDIPDCTQYNKETANNC